MGKIKDLTGQRFGRLTVIGLAYVKTRSAYWKCRCDCGNVLIVKSSYLIHGGTKSCGCLKLEKISSLTVKHNMANTKIFGTWARMLSRCFSETDKKFADYGGRGITVCDEWRDDFESFYNHVSKLEHFGQDGYSIDRIDVNGNYEPGNVRWATPLEQARNKRNNIIVEYNGENMCLKEAAERTGINYLSLYARYCKGVRGAKLFEPIKTHVIIVNYNGEELPLKEAAKRSGINYNTLSGRYREGKRGDDLFKFIDVAVERFKTISGEKISVERGGEILPLEALSIQK